MDKLKKQIERTRKRNLARAKVNYALAIELGFTSYEASVMAHWSQRRIQEFAEEKKNV